MILPIFTPTLFRSFLPIKDVIEAREINAKSETGSSVYCVKVMQVLRSKQFCFDRNATAAIFPTRLGVTAPT